MIISDYARKNDEQTRQCLGGYYKQKLDEYLKLANYTVDKAYRTCIIKNYIKGLGVGTWKQDKKILENCFEIHELEPQSFYVDTLIDEINTIKPSIIICMGEYTLRLLTGKDGIGKWRGSVLSLAPDIAIRLDYPCPRVVCSYHPSVVHTQEELQLLLRMDFKKAVELLFEPTRAIDYHEITIARNSMDVIRFIEQFPYNKYPEMTYDIETRWGFITCAGISFDGYSALCCPLYGATKYDLTDRARYLYYLSQVLGERKLINQNIGYDQRISQRFGLMMPDIIWDTMLAAHTIAPEFPKNLGFLTSVYTDMSYYKDEGHRFDPSKVDFDQLYSYNAKDAISTFQIYKKQQKDLLDMEMLEFFKDFVMPLYKEYYEGDSIGMKVNLTRREELGRKYEALIILKELELEAITQIKINLSSPTQIGKYMESMSFPVLRHRVESGFMVVNTDLDSIKKMLIADAVEYRRCSLPYPQAKRFLNLLLLIRRLKKVVEYVNVGIHPWGRVHTSSRLSASTSGRSGGGKTPDQFPNYYLDKKGQKKISWDKLGQSFQTVTKHGFIIESEDGEPEDEIEDGIIGKDLRDMYEPDPGWVLVEGDGSQAEARICDVLGEDWPSLAEYGKVDKHCSVAAMIYKSVTYKDKHWTYDEIFRMAKKEKNDDGIAMRNIGKHSKHAKNNGMEAFLFAQKYLILPSFTESLKQARLVLLAIDKAYPNIEQVFHKQVEYNLRTHRELIAPRPYGLPCGRKRRFFKKIDKHYLNVAYSYLPQAAISDHTKAARLRIMARVDRTKAYIIAENHDSVTALVKRGYIREYCTIAKEELERPIDFRACSLSRDIELVIPAEFSIGRKRWGAMKEIKRFRAA